MASSGGSIQLRLALVGSEEVKAALASLGPAGARALREIEAAQKAPTAGMRGLSAASQEAQAALQGMATRAGSVGAVFSAMGPAGLAAAAGIGALVAAGAGIVRLAMQTADWALSLDKFTKTTSLSIRTVQEFDFAFQALNIPVDKGRASLQGLADIIGKVQDNLVRGQQGPQIRVFEQILGTQSAAETETKLRQLGDIQHILPVILDYASKLNATQRAGLAQALKVDPDVLESLVELKDTFPDLISAADKYGVVSDDQVKKGADLARQMHETQAVVDGEMRKAFLDLAPAIEGAIPKVEKIAEEVADFAKTVADNWDWISKLVGAMQFLANMPIGAMAIASTQHAQDAARQFVSRVPGGNLMLAALDSIPGEGPIHAVNRSDVGLVSTAAASGLTRGPGSGLPAFNPPATPAGARRGGAHDAGAEKSRFGPENDAGPRALASADEDLLKAKKEELQAQLGVTTETARQADIKKQIAALDEQSAEAAAQGRLAEINQQVTKGQISHATGLQLVMELEASEAIRKHVEALRQQADDDAARKAAAEEQRKLTDIETKSQLDLLAAQLALTTDRKQRLAIELQRYDIEQAALSQAQVNIIKDPNSTGDQIIAAQKTLAGIYGTYDAGRTAIQRQNADPWSANIQKMKDELPSLNDEFGKIAADGLNKFNDGLVESNGRIANLGTLLKQTFADALVELERYLLKQAEIGVLGGGKNGGSGAGGIGSFILSLFGSGGGGAASSAASIGSTIGSMFAAGGPTGVIRGPGTGQSDSFLIAVSDKEFVMNAAATRMYLPILNAMNSARAPAPHFAAGGATGGGLSGVLGGVHVHPGAIVTNIDATGADPAALQRVAETVQEQARNEPKRFVAYAQAMGLAPKANRRV